MVNYMKKFFAFLLSAAIAFLGTSCYSGYIFQLIDSEVALESNGINGTINTIVRHGETSGTGSSIYLANGKLYRKTAESSLSYYETIGAYNCQWENLSLPEELSSYESDDESKANSQVTFLASDSTYLYALGITWYEDTSGYNAPYNTIIFYTDKEEPEASDWSVLDISNITGASDETLKSSGSSGIQYVKSVFDNQYVSVSKGATAADSYDISLRNAYARISNGSSYAVYKLDGGNTPTAVSSGTGADSYTCRAAYYKGTDYFSKYYAFAANDTYIYYAKSYTYDGDSSSDSYMKTDSTLYYATSWTGNDEYTGSVDFSNGSILSIAPASNNLLLGTTSGISHTALSSGVPSEDEASWTATNGSSIISSYVFNVFVLNPSDYEDSTDTSYGTDEYACSTIYGSISSSSDSFDETGLYSYYPGRGTWNRDGTDDNSSGGN